MITVIVTSAGTASAISVIKALKKQTEIAIKIIAVDLDPMAAGLFLADQYFIVPPASSDKYIPGLIEVAKNVNAEILIPIYSKEINLISQNVDLLKRNGLKVLVSNPETIELCNNKISMNKYALAAGLNVPYVFDKVELSQFKEQQLPIFAKPNTGSSSTGAEKVKTLNRLNELLNLNQDYVFQTLVEAEEVTVDVFCNENSEALIVAPRLRLATKSGQSVKGKTLDNSLFKEPVSRLCKKLQIKGVCNVQFFINGNDLQFIELNPRFAAGGLMLTVNAGANIPLILLKTLLNIPIKPEECQTKPNILMTRFWEEIIIDETV